MAGEIVDSVEMLRRLVAFDTTSRNSNLALIDYVQQYMKGHGIESKLVPSEDGKKANLFATVGPNVPGGVVLSGHTDVVPVDGQPWDTDPWTLTLKDGTAQVGIVSLPEDQQLKGEGYNVLGDAAAAGGAGARNAKAATKRGIDG